MAKRGAQLGNQNAVHDKPWRRAIDRALRKRSRTGQMEALDEIADKFLESVMAGDMQAFKELGDRLDGRPHQTVAMDADMRVTDITHRSK